MMIMIILIKDTKHALNNNVHLDGDNYKITFLLLNAFEIYLNGLKLAF